MIEINGTKTCEEAIKAIGQDLINRANEICKDLRKVSSITIYANLLPTEIVEYDVTKRYIPAINSDTNK